MYGKKKINLQSKEEVHSAITNIINDQFDNELSFKKDEIQQISDNLKIVGNLINNYQIQYDRMFSFLIFTIIICKFSIFIYNIER